MFQPVLSTGNSPCEKSIPTNNSYQALWSPWVLSGGMHTSWSLPAFLTSHPAL